MFSRMDLSLIAGHLHEHRRQTEQRSVPHRFHELREPAESQLGSQPAHGCRNHRGQWRADPDQPAVDAQNRVNYRMAVVNNELLKSSFETGTAVSDVYQFLLSFRYTFN